MATITMTPTSNGSVLTKTSTGSIITFNDVPKGTYNVKVTETGYNDYTQQVVVDDDVENFSVTLSKTSSGGTGGTIVFNSKTSSITFAESANGGYLNVESIKLQPNTTYIVSTTDIGTGNSLNDTPNLFANNAKSWSYDHAVTPTKTHTVTTDSTGYVYIAGKPAVDPDGTRMDFNVNKIVDGTYSFVIKTA
ncbi:PEGA domain-containing protein [Jeotgalibaca porci]|uniref:PEGA domain-containing protein n=1 Tax=Jeotgalibaca porci TaxID=1868793 RepID=UPI00359F7DB7